jgi:hypothetical protein
MDKKYRDMTKPKKPKRHTMPKNAPISQVRDWISNNRGREFTKEEISEDLATLSWSQIYGALDQMRRGWEAFLNQHIHFYPDIDPKERHNKLIIKHFRKYHEAPVQYDPGKGKYSVLSWERKNIIDERLEANHWKAAVRKSTERVNLREIDVDLKSFEAAHIGLSLATKTVTDGLAHHKCGALIGPTMGFCPQCGEVIGQKQISGTAKQIESSMRSNLDY